MSKENWNLELSEYIKQGEPSFQVCINMPVK